jgi:hypothetical protein
MIVTSNKPQPTYTPRSLTLDFESAEELEAFTALIGRVGSTAHGIDFSKMYDALLALSDCGIAPLFSNLWKISPCESILEKTSEDIPF